MGLTADQVKGRIKNLAKQNSAYAPTDGIAFGDYSYYNIGDRGGNPLSS